MWKAPQPKTKDEAHILQAFTETLLTGSIACIWCFSQYVQSPSGWLYICKGFWNVNNGTILLPRCTPSHPTNFFCTIQSHPPPTQYLSYPVTQLPHLSVLAAGPIVELGQKDQILSADKVNLNYCQDLIQLVKYEYSFQLGKFQTTKQGNIIILKYIQYRERACSNVSPKCQMRESVLAGIYGTRTGI